MRRTTFPSEPTLFDPHEPHLDLEMTEGHRPASTTGDRLMVGLAAIALLGGALIGVSRLFSSDDAEASVASHTPGATVAATPTARPTPQVTLVEPLRTFRLSEEPLPEVDTESAGWGGWARATKRIKVRATPSTDAPAVATFNPGDALWVQTEPELFDDWLRVDGPATGWIHSRGGPEGNLHLFDNPSSDGASIDSITAGADGRFVVTGARSSDGAYVVGVNGGAGRWQPVEPQEMLDDIGSFQAAYGPRGWIALVTIEARTGARAWIWQSDDGSSWRALGALRDLPGNGLGPLRLAGSPLGYAMTPFYVGDQPVPRRLWYSADGEVWSERETPIAPSKVVAAGIGFYAYATSPQGLPTSDGGQAAFSENGWDWSAVDVSDMAEPIGVAGADDRLVALDRVGRIVHTWTARLEGGLLVWRRELISEGEFEDAVVTEVSGGLAPIATGYERGTEAALWWSNDEDGWHRHRLPASFGGIPSIGAASGRGYVVVGTHESVLGDTPLLWSAGGSTRLHPEAQPMVPPVADLGSEGCASYSRDLLEFMASSGIIQAHCYGDAPVTLTAYVPRCYGCSSEPRQQTGTYRPQWLNQTVGDRILRLSPVALDDRESFDAVLSASLQPDPTWQHHWVEATGHFDDPAAASCRFQPGPDDERWYPGRQKVIADCRSRFVVTSVKVLRER
jgi:hypothetical protein